MKIAALMVLAWLARALKPLVHVRFGTLFVSRPGHLAGNTECYLCERDAGVNRPKRSIDIWTPVGTPANTQLLKMYSRVMPVWPWAIGIHTVGQFLQSWKDEHTFTDEQWGRDVHNLLEKSPPHLKFTAAEEKRGLDGLRALGMPESAKRVCIVNRDPMYLRAVAPGQDYSYHSFRDSKIDNYRDAAAALAQRGYWVLRMGTFVDEPMRLRGPQFLDYACSGMRSDFMDVYLGAKCAFTISNGTGFDGIPMVFRRPICFVNEAPWEYLSTWMVDSLAIWKHHERNGKRMSIDEIIISGAGLFSRTAQFEAAGIKLIENTPEEIKDAALELDDRLKGLTSVYQTTDGQRAFWARFPRSVSPANGKPLHGEIRLRIGSKFLAGYAL